jgi:alkylhydroperoxidase family enzyme
MPQIVPIPRDQWTKEMIEALSAMQPPTARHFVPPPGGRSDRPKAASIMGTFAHHPDLAKAYFSFNGHILYGTTLSIRQRELAVLRLAALRQSAYLWAQRLVYQGEAHISDADIARIAFGPDAPFLDSRDKPLLQAVDELIEAGRISADTWRDLEGQLSTQQILDLIFTVGCYDMIAWVCSSLEFDLEKDLARP